MSLSLSNVYLLRLSILIGVMMFIYSGIFVNQIVVRFWKTRDGQYIGAFMPLQKIPSTSHRNERIYISKSVERET